MTPLNEEATVPMKHLTALLPPTEQLSNVSASAPQSSYWTDEEIASATRAMIARHLEAGWKFVDGYLVKGAVKKHPSPLMPSRSGLPDFNPRADAYALRMGAKFARDNRYRLGETMYVDRNGMFIDPLDCPECGGAPWHVKTRAGLPEDAPRWQFNLTYCRRCVTPAELREAQLKAEAYEGGPKKRPGRPR